MTLRKCSSFSEDIATIDLVRVTKMSKMHDAKGAHLENLNVIITLIILISRQNWFYSLLN